MLCPKLRKPLYEFYMGFFPLEVIARPRSTRQRQPSTWLHSECEGLGWLSLAPSWTCWLPSPSTRTNWCDGPGKYVKCHNGQAANTLKRRVLARGSQSEPKVVTLRAVGFGLYLSLPLVMRQLSATFDRRFGHQPPQTCTLTEDRRPGPRTTGRQRQPYIIMVMACMTRHLRFRAPYRAFDAQGPSSLRWWFVVQKLPESPAAGF